VDHESGVWEGVLPRQSACSSSSFIQRSVPLFRCISAAHCNNSATNYTIRGLFHDDINAPTYTMYLHNDTKRREATATAEEEVWEPGTQRKGSAGRSPSPAPDPGELHPELPLSSTFGSAGASRGERRARYNQTRRSLELAPPVSTPASSGNLHTNAPHKAFSCVYRTASKMFSRRNCQGLFSSSLLRSCIFRKAGENQTLKVTAVAHPTPETALEPVQAAAGHPPALRVPAADKSGARRPAWRVTGIARASLFLRAVKGTTAR